MYMYVYTCSVFVCWNALMLKVCVVPLLWVDSCVVT